MAYNKISKVSVVMLAYNNYQNFDTCLRSVAEQRYPNIELILADDCSKDLDTSRIEEKIRTAVGGKTEVICLFNKENLGTVRNFNNAVKHASGELIVPVSMDDSLADEFVIEKIAEHFNRNEVLIGTSHSCHINGQRFKTGPSDKELLLLEDNRKTAQKLLTMGLFFKGANTYYHRDILKKYGFFDEEYRLYEDVPFLLKCLENGEKISVVPYICIYYTLGGSGVTAKNRIHPYLVKDREKLYSKILADKKYKKIHRWVRYNLYRNVNQGKDFDALVRFPDIIIRKAVKLSLNKDKWIGFSDRKEIADYVTEQNKALQGQIQ